MTANPPPRWSLAQLLIQSALGLALLMAWVIWFDGAAALDGLREAPASAVMAMVTFTLLGYLARAARWSALIVTDRAPSRLAILRLTVASAFLNYLIPLRAGDGFRAVRLNRQHGVPFTQAAASVVVDKLFDMAGLLLPLVAVSMGLFGEAGLLGTGLLLASSAALGLVLLLAAARWGLVTRITRSQPFARLGVTARVLRPLDSYLRSLTGVGPLVGATVGTLAIILADSLVMYAAFGAFSPGVDFPRVVVGTALFGFTFVLPAPPGYLGHTELMGNLIYGTALSLPAVAVGTGLVFWHLVNTVTILAAGGLAMSREALGLRWPGGAFSRDDRPAACDGGSIR
ncbi:MAG: flippase-like domain-containing protein [Chloroflexi bacterium]|nr:flippase-like domain-containing protein [Chloroflexota bacterium]